MKRIALVLILTLAALTLTACGTGAALQQVHQNIGTLNTSIESFISGKITAGELTLADVDNAKTIYDAHYVSTRNAFDKADSQCMATLIAYYPTLEMLFGPARPQQQAAPVTGFFSGIAAAQVQLEDGEASLAAKEAILRKGFPPEVRVACASWWMNVIARGTH